MSKARQPRDKVDARLYTDLVRATVARLWGGAVITVAEMDRRTGYCQVVVEPRERVWPSLDVYADGWAWIEPADTLAEYRVYVQLDRAGAGVTLVNTAPCDLMAGEVPVIGWGTSVRK